jgi:predicted dinucleotide-binding enzyme
MPFLIIPQWMGACVHYSFAKENLKMGVRKTIAIIGAAGNTAIVKSLAKGNNRLLLIGEDNDKLTQLANEIIEAIPAAEIEAMNCVFNGCWEADIIILDVPYAAQKEVAEKIRDVATGKTIISIHNNAEETQSNKNNKGLQELLPYSKIVDITVTANTDETIDVLVTGNDAETLLTKKALKKN